MKILKPYLCLFLTVVLFQACSCSTQTGPNPESKNPEQLRLLWEYGYQSVSPPEFSPTILGDQILISGDLFLTALNLFDGQEIWKEPIPSHRHLRTKNLSITDSQIFSIILSNNQPGVREAIAFNRESGTLLWHRALNDSLQLRQFVHNTTVNGMYAASGENGRLAIIADDGSLFKVLDVGMSPSNVIFENGTLFLSHSSSSNNRASGRISAIDVGSWQTKWEYESPNGWLSYAIPIINDGRVYSGTTEGYASERGRTAIISLDTETGQLIWIREGIQAYSIILEGDYLYINDAGGVHKLRKDNGTTVWHTNFGSSGTAPIAYGYGHIYAPHSGAMRILDVETGEIVHTMSPPDGSYFWVVTADKGRIFAQSSRHLYTFAPWGHDEALE